MVSWSVEVGDAGCLRLRLVVVEGVVVMAGKRELKGQKGIVMVLFEVCGGVGGYWGSQHRCRWFGHSERREKEMKREKRRQSLSNESLAVNISRVEDKDGHLSVFFGRHSSRAPPGSSRKPRPLPFVQGAQASLRSYCGNPTKAPALHANGYLRMGGEAEGWIVSGRGNSGLACLHHGLARDRAAKHRPKPHIVPQGVAILVKIRITLSEVSHLAPGASAWRGVSKGL